MIRFLVTLMALGLLSAPALAQDWAKACNTGTQFATTTVSPGQFVCFDSTSTETSNPLYVGGCENYDVLFEEDITAEPGTSNTGQILVCLDRSSCANSDWILENATFDGDAASGTEAIYGASAIWVRASTTVTAGTARFIVKCNF